MRQIFRVATEEDRRVSEETERRRAAAAPANERKPEEDRPEEQPETTPAEGEVTEGDPAVVPPAAADLPPVVDGDVSGEPPAADVSTPPAEGDTAAPAATDETTPASTDEVEPAAADTQIEEGTGEEERDWGVGLEEAEVMVDEAGNQDEAASEDLERSKRLLEVSDALEDMAVIADEIQEMSPTEQALIANSAQMAVAGTDVEPEEIVPGLESGFRTGMEEAQSLRQRAEDIWKMIQAMGAKIWENIVGFFRNMIGNGVILENRMKKIRAALKDYKPAAGPIEISTGASLLCIDGKPVKSGQELVSAVKELSQTIRWSLETRPSELEEMASGLGKAIEKLDFLSKDGEHMFGEDIFNVVNRQMTLPGGNYSKDPRWPNESLQKGPDLLGGKTLFARTTKESDDKQAPLLVKLERVRNSEMVLDATSVNANPVGKISLPALSPAEMLAIGKEIDDIIDAIASFKNEKGEKRIDAARKKLDESCKKASVEWSKVKDGENMSSPHTQAVMKAALSLNISFAKWAKEPIAGAMKHGMEVCRMLIVLMLKNIAAGQGKAEGTDEAGKKGEPEKKE